VSRLDQLRDRHRTCILNPPCRSHDEHELCDHIAKLEDMLVDALLGEAEEIGPDDVCDHGKPLVVRCRECEDWTVSLARGRP
jgi:hypothetical protein